MHVLIDTNVILDVLEKREPFYRASNDVLSLCASKKIHGFIAFHSVSNIFYILRKRYSAEERRHLLHGILKFLPVANVNHENVQHALERDDFSDFEDCLQDECAAQNHAEYIITRNTNDFSTSNIPAITPSDMLSRI